MLRPSYADDLGVHVGLKHRLDLAIELVGRHLVLGLLDDVALHKVLTEQLGSVAQVTSVGVGPRLFLVGLLDRVKAQLILQVQLLLLAQLSRNRKPLHLHWRLDRLLPLRRLIPSHHARCLGLPGTPFPTQWMSSKLLILDELLLELHLFGEVAALEVALDGLGIQLAVICLDDAL